MLEDLLKYNNLGNKEELSFVLFHLISNDYQAIDDLKKYFSSRFFSKNGSFDGMIALCKFCDLITIKENNVKIHRKKFKTLKLNSENYFKNPNFYEALFESLKKSNHLSQFINTENLRYNRKRNQYYINDNLMPFKFFTIRNVLLSTNFLMRDETIYNHLWVDKNFNFTIKNNVVNIINKGLKKSKKSLEQLKKKIEKQESLGLEAEVFVVNFEKIRLSQHIHLEHIDRISETDVSAGYDIESFNTNDSIFIDRYIEVKSFIGDISFYWSKNELEKARILSDKYYLYLVDRSQINSSEYTPIMIQNPYLKVFKSDFWKKEAESYKMTIDI